MEAPALAGGDRVELLAPLRGRPFPRAGMVGTVEVDGLPWGMVSVSFSYGATARRYQVHARHLAPILNDAAPAGLLPGKVAAQPAGGVPDAVGRRGSEALMPDATRCQYRAWLAAARQARRPQWRVAPADVLGLLVDIDAEEAAAEAAQRRIEILVTWAAELFQLAGQPSSVTVAAALVGETWEGPDRAAEFTDADTARFVALTVAACLRHRHPIPVGRG